MAECSCTSTACCAAPAAAAHREWNSLLRSILTQSNYAARRPRMFQQAERNTSRPHRCCRHIQPLYVNLQQLCKPCSI